MACHCMSFPWPSLLHNVLVVTNLVRHFGEADTYRCVNLHSQCGINFTNDSNTYGDRDLSWEEMDV